MQCQGPDAITAKHAGKFEPLHRMSTAVPAICREFKSQHQNHFWSGAGHRSVGRIFRM